MNKILKNNSISSDPNRANWSMEILPVNFSLISKIPSFVKEIYITMIPGGNWKETLDIAQKVQSSGREAIPHIAARSLKDIKELEECLSGFLDFEIKKVLLIGGGQNKPEGEFNCVMDMLKTGLFSKYKINTIDYAGHPEGNPDDPNSANNLIEKLNWSDEHGIKCRIITQWCFDTETANKWILELREKGINTPVHIGIPGPSSLKTLMRFAKVCGVKASTTVLKKQGLNISKLMFISKPDKIISQLKGYNQLHLYPFGGIEKSSEWLYNWIQSNRLEMS
mgnify:FL=1